MENKFFELMDSLSYLNNDIYEHLNVNRVRETIDAANDFLLNADDATIREVATLFAKDCALKENIRHACFLTIHGLVGKLNYAFQQSDLVVTHDQRLFMAEIMAARNDDFQFWLSMFDDFAAYPLWDVSDFENLAYNLMRDECDNANISEVLSVYFTSMDNPAAVKWYYFLYLAIETLDEDLYNRMGKIFK